MAGRTRTTKKLAQRINLNYFRRSYPIPHWKRVLSIALSLAGLAWLGWDLTAGKQEAFNAGPMAKGHTLVGNDCASCHATASTFGTKVTDKACLSCHNAPAHQAKQTFTPECVSCHVEHQGSFRLSATSDQNCTQCHANLSTIDGKVSVVARINSVSSGHPELTAVRSGHPADPGTIKLNHQIHLKADLKSPQGPVQLQCADCHQPAAQADGRAPAGYMAPVNFEKHCANCHPLRFDEHIEEPAPHKEPAAVHDYVVKTIKAYVAQHPGQADPPRVEDAERLLWQKACKECHPVTFPVGNAPPELPKAAITARWMKNAVFDHAPHQLVACTECHGQAASSKETSDVLLPGIATCQKCHDGGKNSAQSGCFECHVYHDWSKATAVRTTRTISQLKH